MSIVPDTINFHINSACNAHCKYCYRPQTEELSSEDQRRVIDAIVDWDAGMACLKTMCQPL
ncbi:MAG: hypothetical protein WD294_02430 [Phycisphaeraceae bacterium]